VRVPAEKLNTALDQIRAQSKQDPISETANSQDVTNEYIDLQSRLKNLEAAEADLTKIMDQAYKTEDVLSVYNQLVSIREQIEVIKGQIKYYSESAHFSAISVELMADAAVQPIEIGGWQPQGVLKEAVQALIKSLQFLVNALIWIVIYILPVLLVLFVIFILPPTLLIRAWSRRRAKRKAAAQQLAQQTPPEAEK
jgi:Flp pilus assembly protein TadB